MNHSSQNRNGKTVTLPVSMIYVVILAATVFCLLVATLSLLIGLAMGWESGIDEYDPSSDRGSVTTKDPSTITTAPPKQTTGNKTGIALPSMTPSDNVLSTAATDVAMLTDEDVISSQHGILVELTGKTSLAEKSADTVIHPASMTKIMTLLVACENAKDANALLTVKQSMLDRRKALDGSGELVENTTVVNRETGEVANLSVVGHSVTVEDALYLINYQSDTVACLLIAEYIAGSETAFVEMMNDRAESLGLTQTSFVNCTGLTEVEDTGSEKITTYNQTTCREMAAMMTAVLNNPAARTIVSSYSKYEADLYLDGQSTGTYIPFYADWHNKQARLNGNTKAGSITICGGKTGYETIPTSTFVTYGKNSAGKEFVVVVVGRTTDQPNGDAGAHTGVNNATSTSDTRALYRNYAK